MRLLGVAYGVHDQCAVLVQSHKEEVYYSYDYNTI